MSERIFHRAWAEINLDALAENVHSIRALTSPDTFIMGIVKAEGYGHGALQVSRTLLENGVTHLAVATVSEGILLREAGLDCPILLLGVSSSEDAEDIIRYNLSSCVTDMTFPHLLNDVAKKMGKTASIHVKIDTGMNRLGFLARENTDEIVQDIHTLYQLPSLSIDGIFTHFACADEADGAEYTHLQFARFMEICNRLEKDGIQIPLRHAANSAALMEYPETHLDLVRPGIILYGSYPSKDVCSDQLPLRPVMTLKARISHIKHLPAGEPISYGGIYKTKEETVIATLPIGYADGWNRGLSGKVLVSVNGTLVPIVGKICMDQCMIDVTSVKNISVGDEVVLFGDGARSAADLADALGTISYEVLCNISKRVPRVYIKNQEIIDSVSFLA